MAAVEKVLDEAGCDYFSPKTHGITINKGDNESVLNETFAVDHQEVERCDFMVAIWDYLLPMGMSLKLVQEQPSLDGDPQPVIAFTKTMVLPDSGTVWEVGAGYQYGKPIIGLKTQGEQLNLMLARSCICIARSLNDLKEVLVRFTESIKKGDSIYYAATVATLHEKYGWKGSEAG